MKVILVARNALAAYLISSAVRRPVIHDRRLVQEQRPIDVGDDGAGARIVAADDDAVGLLEVVDGGAFAQELGVGYDGELSVRAPFGDDARHLVAGADGHGRLGDDHLVAVEHRGDVLGGLEHVGEIGMAVAAPRGRADGDEHRLGRRYGASEVGREGQPVLAHVLVDQLRQSRLEDRHLAARQRSDLVGVVVDAGHGVPEIGKAGPRYEADISGADHCHAHALFLLRLLLMLDRPPGVCSGFAVVHGRSCLLCIRYAELRKLRLQVCRIVRLSGPVGFWICQCNAAFWLRPV